MFTDDFGFMNNNGMGGSADTDPEGMESSGKKEPEMSEESYKKVLWVHYHLPLDGKPSQEKLRRICEMIKSEDKEIHDEGVTLLLGCLSAYILSEIKTKYRTYMPLYLSDMMQNAYMAVIKDAGKFDPDKGTLTTFYSKQITHGIQNYINGLHGSTPHYTSAMKQIRKFEQRRKEKGLDYNVQDICIETGLPMATILKCLQINGTKSVSLESTDIVDALQSNSRTPEEIVMAKEDIAYARRLVEESHLTNKERICLCLRFGIGSEEDRNRSYLEVQDIMASYGYDLSLSEIQKTLANAYKKIQAEHGRIRRAAACSRIRTDIDRRISGDMISMTAMLSDQEAVAAYFEMNVLRVG